MIRRVAFTVLWAYAFTCMVIGALLLADFAFGDREAARHCLKLALHRL